MTDQELKNIIYEKLKISEKDENIERLTREQMIFITHDINAPSYLDACPGSGKTEVVGIKAAYELIDWSPKYTGIAFLSFTNSASDEISQRVRKYAGYKAGNHPHFIGTIDKWIYNYIFLPFAPTAVGFMGINGDKSPREIFDDKSKAEFLKGYKVSKLRYVTRHSANNLVGIPILPHQYFCDGINNKFYHY